ncbi:hypothetical protein TEA_012831 [Camellia sinensis var. sinensis]|uniref:MSP domain-containing protein n=1 Tax=Camellia sinensis var. sinensis TaxID=542762 RepID=A0A4S4ERN7_CAMSN|nr:hypothetical protein TEA_012831 [Camellia sinensis var. sinensis]
MASSRGPLTLFLDLNDPISFLGLRAPAPITPLHLPTPSFQAWDYWVWSTGSLCHITTVITRTTLSYLVEEAYDPFVNAITAVVSQPVVLFISKGNQCYQVPTSIFEIFPPVALNFVGGAFVVLRPEDYLIHYGFVDGAAMCSPPALVPISSPPATAPVTMLAVSSTTAPVVVPRAVAIPSPAPSKKKTKKKHNTPSPAPSSEMLSPPALPSEALVRVLTRSRPVQLSQIRVGQRNEPGKQVQSAIRIKNTSKSHVAFKFQTTAPKSCFMRPPGAILAPGESLIATVFKFVEPPENNEKPLDQKSKVKFKIMSLKVKGVMDYAPELFDEQKDQTAVEQILRVVFLDVERPTPALEKLKQQLAEAEAALESRKKPPEDTGPKIIGEGLVIDEWVS